MRVSRKRRTLALAVEAVEAVEARLVAVAVEVEVVEVRLAAALRRIQRLLTASPLRLPHSQSQ